MSNLTGFDRHQADQGAELYRKFLVHMNGGRPLPPGMEETARRHAHWLYEQLMPGERFSFTTFKTDSFDQMVAMGPIRFHAVCEHHVLPFSGDAYVAYLPSKTGGVVGLSKLARAVRSEAKGLNVQEDMTARIASLIHANLKPRFTMVLTRARHSCMEIRGVQSEGTVTSCSYILPKAKQRDETMKSEAFRLWGIT